MFSHFPHSALLLLRQLNNGLSIKGLRHSIYTIAPDNSVPAYSVLHILARENGATLE
ncbi:MAG: hypothetical protein LBH00_09110 [Planctomycetaceae bacterium]|nr:hypothetical protein [Planctomycetaceae bacterium]